MTTVTTITISITKTDDGQFAYAIGEPQRHDVPSFDADATYPAHQAAGMLADDIAYALALPNPD